MDGRFFLPLEGCSSVLLPVDDRDDPGITEGSSNCPAGVRSKPPSGLNVRRRKKFVKLSSPYSFTEDHDAAGDGRVRIAGRAGIGEGERPNRL
jgi:hypothetical protein